MLVRAFVVLLPCCALAPTAFGEATGSVCLARVSYLHPNVKYAVAPPPATRPYMIRIDDGPAIAASEERAIRIADLALTTRHRVSVASDGNRIAAFGFRFRQYETAALCLLANDFYGTWSLVDAKTRPERCRC
jgi:hypothetical protein